MQVTIRKKKNRTQAEKTTLETYSFHLWIHLEDFMDLSEHMRTFLDLPANQFYQEIYAKDKAAKESSSKTIGFGECHVDVDIMSSVLKDISKQLINAMDAGKH